MLRRFGIDEAGYERAVCAAIGPTVRAYGDAVRAVREVHRRGYLVYPATTNGALACRAKLEPLGLAGQVDSGCFCELFGGSDVHPQGKTTPQFYTSLLERIGLEPGEVVMVGDHPEFDLSLARSAGIRQVVLPRRTQSEPMVVEADGGVYVRSLDVLLDLLPREPLEGN